MFTLSKTIQNVCLFVLKLNIQVNNVSVMSGQKIANEKSS